MTSVIAAILAASVGPITFQAPGGFIVVSRSGEVLEKIGTLGDKRPESLAVSPVNSKLFVFTAKSEGQPQALLYKYERGNAKAQILGRGVGFHAHPSFTNDGQWVYFIHHPTKDGGPPGMHATREYGQLWRIGVDGSGLEQLTKSRGCKLYPDARDDRRVAFTHADCGEASGLEELATTGVRSIAEPSASRTHLPRYSADGRRIAAVRLESERVLVLTCARARGTTCTVIATLPRDAEPQQLAWDATDSALFLALGPFVHRIEHSTGVVSQLINLLEVQP